MKFIRYITIIFVVYIAISLTTARLLIANVDNSVNYIESYLSKNNIVDIQIVKIVGNWRGLYPSIEVFFDNKNRSIAENKTYPNNVKININIYKSIFLLKPVIREIYLENIYYKSDLRSLIAFSKSDKIENNIIIEKIKIAKSNFIIKHKKNTFNFENVNILIYNNSINLDAHIDNNKIIQANIKIKNLKLNNFDYKLELMGNFDYKFNNIFNGYNLEVNKSDLVISVSGSHENYKLIKNKISISTNYKSNVILDGRIINNINTDFILDGFLDKHIDFEINKLNFSSKNNNFYNVENVAGIFNNESKNFSLFSKLLDINLNNFYKDYNFTNESNVYFSGKVENLKLKFNLSDFYNNFYFSGDFINSTISSNFGHISNFSGFVNSSDDSTYIKFNSKDTEISYKSILRKVHLYSSINGEIRVSNYSSPIINISSLIASNDDIDITTSGVIDFEKDIIKVFSKINFVDMTKVTNYIPLNLVSNKASNWFKKSFKNGYAKNAYVLINGNLSNYPFYDNNSGVSYAVFPITKLAVDYKSGWIPFNDITGKAHFSKRSVYFESNNINILNTRATNSSLEILDVKNIELVIKSKLMGPFSDLLQYTNTASLTSIENKKILKIKGDSETDFRIKIAFNGSKNDYKSTVKLKNVNYNLDDKNKFTNMSGKIFFNNSLFFTNENEFINANYNSRNINFTLNTDSDKNFIITGNQRININKIIENNSYKDKILGSSLWHYKVKIPGLNSNFKKIKISANSELYETTVMLPEPFKKEKNIKKLMSVTGFLEDNKFSNINITYDGIYAEIASLNEFNGYINFSGKKLSIPKNKFDVVGQIESFNLAEWKGIGRNKSNIDYMQYVNNIDLLFNKFTNDNIKLDNFSIKGFSSEKSFIFNEIIVNSNKVNIVSSGVIEFNNITSFKINLNSDNLEELLNYWKFNHSLRDSSINSVFDISWQGGLFDYDLEKIYGNFSTNMKEGRLKKVGNRATRIFGLFNIDLLVKRLSLDFDDVTKNGFYFNTLNGNFRVDSGNIFTTNLVIKGPSAEMLAVGTTDIINETYDMQVVASPEFGEALPAIALLGGPITAAATFAAEKLAKAFGKDINNLIKIKYKVTGSWSDPIIEVINKNENALENVEDLFK